MNEPKTLVDILRMSDRVDVFFEGVDQSYAPNAMQCRLMPCDDSKSRLSRSCDEKLDMNTQPRRVLENLTAC
jgi:hypothetical protein